MSEPLRISVVDDERFRQHRAPSGHPERPERLAAVARALAPFAAEVDRIAPRAAETRELLRVHDRAQVALVEQAAARAPVHLDPDTYVSSASYEVARLGAGAAVDLSCAVARGEARCGFAAVRPPGHHAEADRAMGFCLFNNVAIAARALQSELGVDKLMILDWDVHHGNGTQHSFEGDASVLYVSTHQYPHYPGTGRFDEAGRGAGLGSTVNLPMPAGCGDVEHLGLLHRVVTPIARRFAPEMILVSCGFDGHRADPLAGMELGFEGYLGMTRIVRALAEELCQGRLVFVLEGGYAEIGLAEGVAAVLTGVLESPRPALPPLPDAPPGSTLRALVDAAAAVHAARCPEIGAP